MDWTCLVHFSDGTEAVHLILGPVPNPGDVVSIRFKDGLWRVTDATVGFVEKDIDGVEIEGEITVIPLTEEETASQTGYIEREADSDRGEGNG
jgi:hypothetical protein